MIFGKPSLRKSVDAFAAAVAAHDSKRSQAALQAVERAMRSSRAGAGPGREEWTEAGPRLAALMDQVPPGPRSVLAVMVGACVEGGADPAACAGPVLSGALAALEDAARLSGTRQPAEFHASAEGQSLEQWEMAAVAMLSHQAVR